MSVRNVGHELNRKDSQMLSITRKPGQSLFIGEAEVVVQKTARGRVTLGIKAPREVTILRAEIKRKETENE